MTRQLPPLSTKIRAKRFQNDFTDHSFMIYCGRLSMSIADRVQNMRVIIIWMHCLRTAKRVLQYVWLEEPELVYSDGVIELNIFAVMCAPVARMPHLPV